MLQEKEPPRISRWQDRILILLKVMERLVLGLKCILGDNDAITIKWRNPKVQRQEIIDLIEKLFLVSLLREIWFYYAIQLRWTQHDEVSKVSCFEK